MPRMTKTSKMDAGTRTVVTNGRALLRQASNLDASPMTKTDGMANIFTAMGTSLDRARHTQFVPNGVLDWRTIENMYRGDGLVRKIIDKQVEAMTYRGYEIEGDTDGELFRMMEQKGLNRAVRESLRWANLYGGALGGVLINDGGHKLDYPLRTNRIVRVDSAKVWNRWRTWWSISDAYTDPMSPKYMTPSKYKVIPLIGSPFTIHESRTFRMDGLVVTDTVRIQNLGWGDSIIQAIWEQLRQLATVYNGTERIVDNFIQEVLTMKNLANLLMTDEGERTVKKRMEILDLSASNYRMRMLDAELETYTKQASTVTGLADLMDRFGQVLSSVTNIPQSILFGKSEAGLQNNGDNQIRAWYDVLAAQQVEKLTAPLTYLINLILLSDEYQGPLKNKLNPTIRFNPLWQMDELEDSERRLNIARMDQAYYAMGKTGQSILTDRFGGDHYSVESTFNEGTDFEERAPAKATDPATGAALEAEPAASKKTKAKNKAKEAN